MLRKFWQRIDQQCMAVMMMRPINRCEKDGIPYVLVEWKFFLFIKGFVRVAINKIYYCRPGTHLTIAQIDWDLSMGRERFSLTLRYQQSIWEGDGNKLSCSLCYLCNGQNCWWESTGYIPGTIKKEQLPTVIVKLDHGSWTQPGVKSRTPNS